MEKKKCKLTADERFFIMEQATAIYCARTHTGVTFVSEQHNSLPELISAVKDGYLQLKK